MIQSASISKSFVYFIFALVLIDLQLAIILVILLAAMGYTGFDTSKITVTTCTLPLYNVTKFSALYQMQKVSFIMSLISLICLIVIFIISLIWLIRVCKTQFLYKVQSLIQRNTKIILYLIGSINIMALVPIFGYYLTFAVQIGTCDVFTYDLQQIIAITTIAAIFLFVSLAILVIFLYLLWRDTTEEKYKEVENYQTHNTEPAEKVHESKYKAKEVKNQQYEKKPAQAYEKKPSQVSKHPSQIYRNPSQVYKNQRANPSPPPPPPKIYTYQPEHTQQNLFQSSTKKPLAYNNYKQPIPQQNKYKSPIQKYGYQKQPQPKAYSNISANYIPPQNKLSPPKPNEPMYYKNRSPFQRDDQDSFKNEQQKYLSKYGGPILPSSGVSEVEKRSRVDYFNSPNKRSGGDSSPNHGGREGILTKYIRGKYAN